MVWPGGDTAEAAFGSRAIIAWTDGVAQGWQLWLPPLSIDEN